MTEDQIEMMKSSKSQEEWDTNCDRVKAAHGGHYPADWFARVIESGVLAKTQKSWSKN